MNYDKKERYAVYKIQHGYSVAKDKDVYVLLKTNTDQYRRWVKVNGCWEHCILELTKGEISSLKTEMKQKGLFGPKVRGVRTINNYHAFKWLDIVREKGCFPYAFLNQVETPIVYKRDMEFKQWDLS